MQYASHILQVAEAGGNSVRVWVHVEGDSRWIIEIHKHREEGSAYLSLDILPFSDFELCLHSAFVWNINCLTLCSPYWDSDGFTLGTDEAGDSPSSS